MSGAAFHKGESKQDYSTPAELLGAFRDRFGAIVLDLAATFENAVCDEFVAPEHDSLSQPWESYIADLGSNEWLWLNPPYSEIKPWARKAHEATRAVLALGPRPSDRGIAMLVPADISVSWWELYVAKSAEVHVLKPRPSFDGKHPFPKGLAVLLYTPAMRAGLHYWRWRALRGKG